LKLKIRLTKSGPKMQCPHCKAWVKIDIREVKSIPVSVECICGKKWGVFTYKGE